MPSALTPSSCAVSIAYCLSRFQIALTPSAWQLLLPIALKPSALKPLAWQFLIARAMLPN